MVELLHEELRRLRLRLERHRHRRARREEVAGGGRVAEREHHRDGRQEQRGAAAAERAKCRIPLQSSGRPPVEDAAPRRGSRPRPDRRKLPRGARRSVCDSTRTLHRADSTSRTCASTPAKGTRARRRPRARVRRGLAGGESAGRAARTARAAAPGGGGPRRTLAVSSCFLRSDLPAARSRARADRRGSDPSAASTPRADLRDRQRRAPLALQNVEANAAVAVHVAVVGSSS